MSDESGLPELEQTCRWCKGNYVSGGCPDCDGTGYELTPAGEKVMTLLNRRFKRLLRDAVS